jgi:hypothetical protein
MIYKKGVGNFTFQFNCTVNNNSNADISNWNLWVITANSGFFESVRGSSRIVKGVLDERSIISAPPANMTRASLDRFVGAGSGFIGKLGNSLTKHGHHIAHHAGQIAHHAGNAAHSAMHHASNAVHHVLPHAMKAKRGVSGLSSRLF